MATISETELQRRLRALERSTGGVQKIFVSDIDPSGTGYADGDTHYNSATGNLWLFSNGSWGLSVTRLHIRYADSVTNLNTAGIAPAQNDITGFSILPYTAGGVQKAYRGLWFGGAVASTDPTDYEWTLTAGESGAVPTYERYYSTTAGLLSQMGDPDTVMTGVTWVSISGAAPSTAYWIAERFTIDGVVSAWQVYPVQAKDGGIPFVTYTKSGYNMPTLGDSTWIADAVVAVSNFTGRVYTNQKEFGYGTTVVITYDDGKLYGTLKRSGGADVWSPPASFIDGNLIVDGTVAAQHIAATSIDATKLVVSGGNAINYSTVGADPVGAAVSAQLAAIAAAALAAQTKADLAQTTAEAYADGIVTAEEARAILDATTKANAAQAAAEAASDASGTAAAAAQVITDNIYTSGTTTIDGGKVTTGSIDAVKITASSITANEISSGSLTADLIAAGAVTADKITLSENVEFTGDSSGIIFNKTSLTDGAHGAFYGRGTSASGTDIAGFAISSTTSSILMDSGGTFRLIGVDIFTGSPGAVTEYSTAGTHVYQLGVTTTALDITIIAGGGSGSSNAAGDRSSSWKVNGNAGSPTSVAFYASTDGTGSSLGGYTTTGGAGGVWSVQGNLNYGYGASGAASSKAPGGAGGTPSTPSSNTGAGTYGSGGGSGGAYGFNGSPIAITNNGGGAGTTLSITSIPSGALSVKFTIGSGGAAPTLPSAALTAAVTPGGSGGVGYASVSNPAGGGTKVALEDIWKLPTQASLTTSVMTGNTNGGFATLSLGSGGAGWYYFQDFTRGCTLNNAKGWDNSTSNPDNAILRLGVSSSGLAYCTGTPYLRSLVYGNSNQVYSGGSIKWVRLYS